MRFLVKVLEGLKKYQMCKKKKNVFLVRKHFVVKFSKNCFFGGRVGVTSPTLFNKFAKMHKNCILNICEKKMFGCGGMLGKCMLLSWYTAHTPATPTLT